jgi:NitT/TauT family transport system substrate-binding protein
MQLTLAENFRAVFYTPFYLLKELRLAEQAGLHIEWLAPGSPGGAIDQVKDGSVDLTWGGPMRVMKDHDTCPADGSSLRCFGEVVARDPFFLMGSQKNCSLQELAHLRLSLVSEVPTPWMCLQADLRDLGLNIEQLELSGQLKRGWTMAEQIHALDTQDIDVIQLFEPFVSEVLKSGRHNILYAAYSRGPTVYTAFICSQEGFAKKQAAFARLNEVLGTLQTWLHAHSAQDIAHIVQPYFAELELDVLTSAIDRYLQNQVWAATPEISRAGFDRLADSLHSGGFIQTRILYESCIKSFN